MQRLLNNKKLCAQAWIQYTRQKKGSAQRVPPRRLNACLAARKIEVALIASPISTNLHQHGSLKELARPSRSSAVRCQPLATIVPAIRHYSTEQLLEGPLDYLEYALHGKVGDDEIFRQHPQGNAKIVLQPWKTQATNLDGLEPVVAERHAVAPEGEGHQLPN